MLCWLEALVGTVVLSDGGIVIGGLIKLYGRRYQDGLVSLGLAS